MKVSANPKLSAIGIEEARVAIGSGGRKDPDLGNAKVQADRVPMLPPRSRLVESVTLVGKTRTRTVSFTSSSTMTHHMVCRGSCINVTSQPGIVMRELVP